MSDRFIVDFKVAIEERDSLFGASWSWPVPQTDYDDLIREYLDWIQRTPHRESLEIPQLETFNLIESELLKDLGAIIGSFLEVSVASQRGLKLVYDGNSHPLHSMMEADEFHVFSPTSRRQQMRASEAFSIRRRLRRFVGKSFLSLKHQLFGLPHTRLISTNTLSRELTANRGTLIRIDHADVVAQRSQASPLPWVQELSGVFAKELVRRLIDSGHNVTNNFLNYIGSLTSAQLSRAWADREYRPGFEPSPSMTLFTGSGGNYLARLVSHSFVSAGARVIRTTHGGDNPLFEDPMWPSNELAFADDYVTYGSEGIPVVKQKIKAQSERSRSVTRPRVHAGGSLFHASIPSRSYPSRKVETVHVVSQSFSAELRASPNMCLPDVVYFDWHRRLLSELRLNGFRTVAKRHPKGVHPGIKAYDDVATSELRMTSMDSIYADAEAYVFDCAFSAFMEAMCTLKPVVLIHIPFRRFAQNGREAIQKSAKVIDAYFDELNRIQVDVNSVVEAIQHPVDVEARRQFIEDYLTNSSTSVDEVKSIIS